MLVMHRMSAFRCVDEPHGINVIGINKKLLRNLVCHVALLTFTVGCHAAAVPFHALHASSRASANPDGYDNPALESDDPMALQFIKNSTGFSRTNATRPGESAQSQLQLAAFVGALAMALVCFVARAIFSCAVEMPREPEHGDNDGGPDVEAGYDDAPPPPPPGAGSPVSGHPALGNAASFSQPGNH